MLTATNLSLRSMILMAYQMKDYQVEGPDWLATERYDLAARFPETTFQEPKKYDSALGAMMQKMLTDRFKLAIHRDQKVFPVYGLTAGKGAVKFQEGQDCAEKGQNSNSNDNHYSGICVYIRGVSGTASGSAGARYERAQRAL